MQEYAAWGLKTLSVLGKAQLASDIKLTTRTKMKHLASGSYVLTIYGPHRHYLLGRLLESMPTSIVAEWELESICANPLDRDIGAAASASEGASHAFLLSWWSECRCLLEDFASGANDARFTSAYAELQAMKRAEKTAGTSSVDGADLSDQASAIAEGTADSRVGFCLVDDMKSECYLPSVRETTSLFASCFEKSTAIESVAPGLRAKLMTEMTGIKLGLLNELQFTQCADVWGGGIGRGHDSGPAQRTRLAVLVPVFGPMGLEYLETTCAPTCVAALRFVGRVRIFVAVITGSEEGHVWENAVAWVLNHCIASMRLGQLVLLRIRSEEKVSSGTDPTIHCNALACVASFSAATHLLHLAASRLVGVEFFARAVQLSESRIMSAAYMKEAIAQDNIEDNRMAPLSLAVLGSENRRGTRHTLLIPWWAFLAVGVLR